jgi:uncharacterized protein YbaR (Trm112 family)
MAPELLDLLLCPLCFAAVDGGEAWLSCRACRRRYPLREGLPVLLLEEAELEPAPDAST